MWIIIRVCFGHLTFSCWSLIPTAFLSTFSQKWSIDSSCSPWLFSFFSLDIIENKNDLAIAPKEMLNSSQDDQNTPKTYYVKIDRIKARNLIKNTNIFCTIQFADMPENRVYLSRAGCSIECRLIYWSPMEKCGKVLLNLLTWQLKEPRVFRV